MSTTRPPEASKDSDMKECKHRLFARKIVAEESCRESSIADFSIFGLFGYNPSVLVHGSHAQCVKASKEALEEAERCLKLTTPKK